MKPAALTRRARGALATTKPAFLRCSPPAPCRASPTPSPTATHSLPHTRPGGSGSSSSSRTTTTTTTITHHRARDVRAAAGGHASSQPDPGSAARSSLEARLAAAAEQLTGLFPVWMVLTGVLALTCPQLFLWFGTQYTTGGLALTMLGMGFTLTIDQFAGIFRNRPYLLLLGLALQYSVLPVLGLLISRAAGLAAPLAIGLILVSCCPGGTASNIVAYIARGDMPLSIMMTTASTLTAIVATPLLTAKLAGTLVPVDAAALCVSTIQVVLAPVLLGAWANSTQPQLTRRLAQFSPLVATLLVCLIVGSTLAHNAAALAATGSTLVLCVAGLHGSGFLLGYLLSKVLGLSEAICRTNSIEVGMQNSTLGAVLAALHFADPLVAAPCALSACTHATMGSLLAAAWRTMDDRRDPAAGKGGSSGVAAPA